MKTCTVEWSRAWRLFSAGSASAIDHRSRDPTFSIKNMKNDWNYVRKTFASNAWEILKNKWFKCDENIQSKMRSPSEANTRRVTFDFVRFYARVWSFATQSKSATHQGQSYQSKTNGDLSKQLSPQLILLSRWELISFIESRSPSLFNYQDWLECLRRLKSVYNPMSLASQLGQKRNCLSALPFFLSNTSSSLIAAHRLGFVIHATTPSHVSCTSSLNNYLDKRRALTLADETIAWVSSKFFRSIVMTEKRAMRSLFANLRCNRAPLSRAWEAQTIPLNNDAMF